MKVDGILTPEQEAAGLRLEEYNDDLLELWLTKVTPEVKVASFTQSGAHPEAIRMVADYYLEERAKE